MLEYLCREIKEYCDVAVIGLSGGIDSTIVTCICKMALGKEKVIGISMPYGYIDYKTFNQRSKELATRLQIVHDFIPIDDIADSISRKVRNTFGRINIVNEGNARSRARMCVLYAIAHEQAYLTKDKVRVIGTGNLSEDFIGYDTKGGDALADYFPIGELFKSEVYQLADYFKELGWLTEDLIDRKPSAGLWEGQTDEGELGYSYNQMEPAILDILRGSFCSTPIHDFVWGRHLNNKHKHEAPIVTKLRKEFCT